jgi:hypothetical protein
VHVLTLEPQTPLVQFHVTVLQPQPRSQPQPQPQPQSQNGKPVCTAGNQDIRGYVDIGGAVAVLDDVACEDLVLVDRLVRTLQAGHILIDKHSLVHRHHNRVVALVLFHCRVVRGTHVTIYRCITVDRAESLATWLGPAHHLRCVADLRKHKNRCQPRNEDYQGTYHGGVCCTDLHCTSVVGDNGLVFVSQRCLVNCLQCGHVGAVHRDIANKHTRLGETPAESSCTYN